MGSAVAAQKFLSSGDHRSDSCFSKTWREQFLALKLSDDDVGELYRLYAAIVKNSSRKQYSGHKVTSISDVLKYFKVKENRVTIKIFSILDVENTSFLNLRDFVLCVWNFCTLGRKNIGA